MNEWKCCLVWKKKRRNTVKSECPVYDTKQSDGEVPMMLELWGMQSTPSLPSLPGPLWPGVVVPDSILSMGKIELICVLMLNRIVWNWIVFDIDTVITINWIKKELFRNLTVCKKKTIVILKWIVYIRTVWLNWITWNRNVFDN